MSSRRNQRAWLRDAMRCDAMLCDAVAILMVDTRWIVWVCVCVCWSIPGFVGHALLVDLHARYGRNITLFSSSRTRRFTSPNWTFIPCDLTSISSLTSLLHTTRASSIFLSAASHFESTKTDAFNVNVKGTQSILQAIYNTGGTVKRLVYTSSTSVIFNGTDVENGLEDMPYPQMHEFPSYYSASKAEGEKLIISANGKNGLLTTAIRPSGMIG